VNQVTQKLLWLLGGGFFLRFLFVFMDWNLLQVAVYDDAFYYFAIAKNFAATGIITADGITATNGFHPLWLFTVLPIWLTNAFSDIGAIRAVMFIAAVIDTIAGYFIYRILKDFSGKDGWKVAMFGAGLYLFNPVVITQAMSGMETPLVAMMVALWIWATFRAGEGGPKNKWYYVWYAILGGLVFLTRTDLAFLVIGGYIHLLYKFYKEGSYGWQAYILPTISLAVVSPWLIWNLKKFGTIFQASGSAYPWIFKDEFINWYHHSYFSTELIYKFASMTKSSLWLIGGYTGGTILFLILVGMFIGMRGSAVWLMFTDYVKRYRWALIATVGIVFIHTYFRWFPRIWYFHSLYLVLLLVYSPIIYTWCRKYKIALFVSMCVGFFVIMTNISGGSGAFKRAWKTQKRAMVATQGLQVMPAGTVLGAWNSGYPQYFCPDSVTLINLDGLANNEVISYYRDGRFMEYLDSRNITFIIDNELYMNWSFGKYIEDDQRYRVERVSKVENIGRRGNDMCLFRINPPRPDSTAVETEQKE